MTMMGSLNDRRCSLGECQEDVQARGIRVQMHEMVALENQAMMKYEEITEGH